MPENAGDHSTDERGDDLDIERLAALCSVGAPIPDDLSNDQKRKLMVAIASRRKRLIHLIAVAIAEDIWRERQP